jgi:hypothetical protein
MASTNALAAKRAIIERLKAAAALEGVQVLYAFRGTMTNRCIYGGGVTFDQPEDEEAVEGRSRVVQETATIGLHIRVVRSPAAEDGIELADVDCEEIADAVAEDFAADPHLAGGKSITRIQGGQGDYSPNDTDDISTLSLRITVVSWVTTERQQP